MSLFHLPSLFPPGLLFHQSLQVFFSPILRRVSLLTERQFGDNHKVKLGKKRSKTNGVKLSKMASGLWVSLRYFPLR